MADFVLGDVLGKGSFGTVWKAMRKGSPIALPGDALLAVVTDEKALLRRGSGVLCVAPLSSYLQLTLPLAPDPLPSLASRQAHICHQTSQAGGPQPEGARGRGERGTSCCRSQAPRPRHRYPTLTPGEDLTPTR